MSKRSFSEVSHTFNEHIGNLNRARQMFEQELKDLNDLVAQHLKEIVGRPSERMVQKVKWTDPKDWSTSRDVAWTNFVTATQLSMDVRQPGYKYFKRAVGFVYFEAIFYDPSDRFIFQCRFENQNIVHADIDEYIIHTLETAADCGFPGFEHVKTSTAVLMRRDLTDELFDQINQIIDGTLQIVDTAIDELYPDELYVRTGTGNAEEQGSAS